MNSLLFKILQLISKSPLRILYIFSDLLYFFMFRVVGYRRQVVWENLKNSFPEKSDTELKQIGKQFYRNFADYIAETLKSFTISKTELLVRMQHLNRDIFQQAKDEKKNIIMLSGHVFNWEWFNALAEIIPQEHSYPVYRKMQSKFWDIKMREIRNSFGNHALEDVDVIRHIFRNPNDGNSTYMFVADQSPAEIKAGIKFLNQNTPVFIGYDKLATRMDLAFVYCEMKKVKRGYYQVNYHRIYPDGEQFQEYEVVRKYYELLEQTINKRPDNWLWSHRRWKRKDNIKTFIDRP